MIPAGPMRAPKHGKGRRSIPGAPNVPKSKGKKGSKGSKSHFSLCGRLSICGSVALMSCSTSCASWQVFVALRLASPAPWQALKWLAAGAHVASSVAGLCGQKQDQGLLNLSCRAKLVPNKSTCLAAPLFEDSSLGISWSPLKGKPQRAYATNLGWGGSPMFRIALDSTCSMRTLAQAQPLPTIPTPSLPRPSPALSKIDPFCV